MGRVIALATIVVGGLVVADLWAHPGPTKASLHTITTESRLLAGK